VFGSSSNWVYFVGVGLEELQTNVGLHKRLVPGLENATSLLGSGHVPRISRLQREWWPVRMPSDIDHNWFLCVTNRSSGQTCSQFGFVVCNLRLSYLITLSRVFRSRMQGVIPLFTRSSQ
jgi:hypothetical protein